MTGPDTPCRRNLRQLAPFVVGLVVLLFVACADTEKATGAALPTGIGKAGVASSAYLWSAPSKLSSIGATWAYDWSAQAPPADSKLQWVPMVEDAGSLTPTAVATLHAAATGGQARYLLTFNEPDNVHQADMTPEQAAALWPQLERTGLLLSSPATDWVGDGWLGKFMAIAHRRRLRVNFIALHYYQDFTNPNAVRSLRQSLFRIYDTYHLPIWVTELGAMDIRYWGHPMQQVPTQSMATSYLLRALTMLNSLSFVQRYAWFTDTCKDGDACSVDSLFDGSGIRTPLGMAFAQAANASRAASAKQKPITQRATEPASKSPNSSGNQAPRARPAGGFS